MSKLEQNTTALDEVLAMVNALPDAGSGGGGVETCTVTVNDVGNVNYLTHMRYVNGEFIPTSVNFDTINGGNGYGEYTLEDVPKNSIVAFLVEDFEETIIDGDATLADSYYNYVAFWVKGDAYIEIV